MTDSGPALPPDLPKDVIDAISANRKIDAIKILREQRGLGLKEAKHAVEAFQRDHPRLQPRRPPRRPPEPDSGVVRLVLAGLVIGAIYFLLR